MSAADLFADVKETDGLVTTYSVRLQVRNLIVGGIPSDPSVVRSWIKSRLELGDAALEELVAQTIEERNGPMSVEDKIASVMTSEHAPSVNGFKRDAEGYLCYEGRNLKAALKEAANSAYPGTEYPGKDGNKTLPPKKGLMRTLAERVFVPDALISLGVKEPTRVEERVKHPMTPQGPRSAISVVEVVERPILETTVRVHDDFLPRAAWSKIWTRLEDIGIGADRGRSDGTFDLLEWTKLN